MQEKKPVVAILMGSNSDWDVMKNAAEMPGFSVFHRSDA